MAAINLVTVMIAMGRGPLLIVLSCPFNGTGADDYHGNGDKLAAVMLLEAEYDPVNPW